MMEGGCRCGAVRYTLAVDAPPAVYCCHCLHCQSWTGSAFSEQAFVPADAISATGPVTSFAMQRGDGGTSTHHVCGICHTRLWNVATTRPSLAIVRAGTLDDSAALSPVMHIWTSRKQDWITIDPAVPSFAEHAPLADLLALAAH